MAWPDNARHEIPREPLLAEALAYARHSAETYTVDTDSIAFRVLIARLDEIEDRDERVRELHGPSPLSGDLCATCRVPMPCRTRRELDGET